MEVKYTHLLTSRDLGSKYHVAVIGRRLYYKVLSTGGASGVVVVNANSVEEFYGDSASFTVTPLNKFTGNSGG